MILVAGPCGIESKEQAFKIAEFVKSQGVTHFRGGAFKGQNHPVIDGKPEYLGLRENALIILSEIQDKLNLHCICDVQSVEQFNLFFKYDIDTLMIGARNMDNLALLRDIRSVYKHCPNKNIILKRAPSATIDEFIGAAEHLGGSEQVILCERGIVSYDRTPQTRWRLDFVGIAYIKKYTNYRIIVAPSHGSGDRQLVPLLCKAGLSIADGLMVEVHYDPDSSTTDAKQTIDFEPFKEIAEN